MNTSLIQPIQIKNQSERYFLDFIEFVSNTNSRTTFQSNAFIKNKPITKFASIFKRYFFLSLLYCFTFLTGLDAFSQCSGCTVTNPVSSGNYTFTSGSVVCFTNNATLGDVTFENGSKICIAPNATVIIQNNVNSTNGHNITFEIGGTLQFNQSVSINANLSATINSGGTLKAGQNGNVNFTLNGATSSIINNGTVQVGVFQYTNNNSTNIFDNTGTVDIDQNVNISGTTTFRNSGTINIGQSYNNNSTSLYINCGTIISQSGLNLSGGRVINTGSYTIMSGSVDLTNGSILENYGTVDSEGALNNSGTITNEGLFKINNYNGSGGLRGPSSSSKKGYFEVNNALTTNQAPIGPNLDFKRTSGTSSESTVFNNTPTYVDSSGNPTNQTGANVSYDCRATSNCSAPLISNLNACPNLQGEFAPLPVDWLGIQVKSVNNAHLVTWRVAREMNVSHYVLERKISKEREFTQILAEVKAHGNETRTLHYDLEDEDLSKSGVYVYRVKQYDFDGKFTYSPLAKVIHHGDYSIKMYPNPAGNETSIEVILSNDAEVKIELFDATLKLVKVIQTSQLQIAGHMIYKNGLEDLPTGVYNMLITIDGVMTMKKLTKIE